MPRMKPIEIESGGETLNIECAHKNAFPPLAVLQEPDYGPALQQRADGVISDADYNQFLTWQNVCGTMQMNAKCLHCKHCKVKIYDPKRKEERWVPLISEEVRAMPFYRKIHKGNL